MAQTDEVSFPDDTVVWSKLKTKDKPWPSVIRTTDQKECPKELKAKNPTNVVQFFDEPVSWGIPCSIQDWDKHFEANTKGKLSKKLQAAIEMATSYKAKQTTAAAGSSKPLPPKKKALTTATTETSDDKPTKDATKAKESSKPKPKPEKAQKAEKAEKASNSHEEPEEAESGKKRAREEKEKTAPSKLKKERKEDKEIDTSPAPAPAPPPAPPKKTASDIAEEQLHGALSSLRAACEAATKHVSQTKQLLTHLSSEEPSLGVLSQCGIVTVVKALKTTPELESTCKTAIGNWRKACQGGGTPKTPVVGSTPHDKTFDVEPKPSPSRPAHDGETVEQSSPSKKPRVQDAEPPKSHGASEVAPQTATQVHADAATPVADEAQPMEVENSEVTTSGGANKEGEVNGSAMADGGNSTDAAKPDDLEDGEVGPATPPEDPKVTTGDAKRDFHRNSFAAAFGHVPDADVNAFDVAAARAEMAIYERFSEVCPAFEAKARDVLAALNSDKDLCQQILLRQFSARRVASDDFPSGTS